MIEPDIPDFVIAFVKGAVLTTFLFSVIAMCESLRLALSGLLQIIDEEQPENRAPKRPSLCQNVLSDPEPVRPPPAEVGSR